MARGYLGKISAVVAINTGGVKPSLNTAKKDIESWGSTVGSRIRATSEAAKRSVEGIFTPLQKLQAAVNAANRNPLKLDIPNVRAYLDLARAVEQISKPLGAAQKQFTGLSQGVQTELLPAFRAAQKQATQLFDAISSGAKVSDRDFANTEARINRVIQAISRANEASQAVRGLATGQELRFRNPEFLQATNRASSLQQQAAALSPEAIAGRGIVNLIGQQRQAADEAERLRSTIERITITRRGDAQVAQQAYSQQLAALERINDELQQQIGLAQAAAGRRSAFDSQELDRRSGALARRNANSFEDATAGVMGFSRGQDERLIGRITPSIDSVIVRIRELDQQYQALPEAARAALDPQVNQLNSIANAARSGAASVGVLEDAYNRTRVSVESAAEAVRASEFQFTPGDPTGEFGPPRPSTPLPPDYLRGRAVSEASAGLGTDIAGPQRALDNLRGAIGSVKGQIDSLPAGLRGQFIPAIQGAEAEYRRLYSTARVTTAEIQESATRLATLEQGISRASSAARQFGGTFAQFRDSLEARGAAGGLEFLRTALARATGDATRAAAAVDRLAEAYQEAASTPGGFQRNAAELQRLSNEAIEATAAVEGVGQSQAALQRGFARTGDVARGAFGNTGLAIQQAAFAIDDFFSVTGGLDQRIRAAGNNISQLGFIIGGTTGLIAGIAASIGSQLIVALIRWYNEGRTTEDQVKSLNDALARQKSLVEDLKQAFESLGDSIARRAFSEPAQQAREFAKSLDEITKKQKESREKRIADLDPYVQRERAEQARIQRELENEQDPNRRVVLQRDLRRAQRGERAVTEGLIAGAPTTQRDRDREIAGLERVFTDVNDRLFREGGVGRPVARNQAQQLIASIQGGSASDQTTQLRDQQRAIDNEARSGRLSRPIADQAIAQLELVINRLEFAAETATDELSVRIARSSFAASLAIEDAQKDVADAIRRGVQGAGEFRNELDKLARELNAAQTELTNAQSIDSSPEDRERAVRAAEARIAGVQARQNEVDARARAVRTGRTFGGDRTTAALSALRGDERLANEFARAQAFLIREIEKETDFRRRLDQAIASGDDAAVKKATEELEIAQKASEAAAAYGEAVVALEDALGRIRKIASGALSQSEQIADNAQRNLTDNPTARNRQARDEAELQLIRDRERIAMANNALDSRRSSIPGGGDKRIDEINAELEAITQERKRLEEQASKPGGAYPTPDEVQRLADREAQLLAERETRLYELTEAERRQIDAINEEIAARRRMIDFEDEVRNRRNPVGNDIRGLDLLERPGQQAARELRQQIADIRAATQANVALAIKEGRFGDIAAAQQQGKEAERRAQLETFRQQAPAIFGLADSVANAVLQGPSRAALQPTDVSTVEGSRELTRLLRGDDAAKDQANMVELQREANRLLDIIANGQPQVAN